MHGINQLVGRQKVIADAINVIMKRLALCPQERSLHPLTPITFHLG